MDTTKRSAEKKSAEGNFRNRVTVLAGKIDSSRIYRKLKLQQEFLEKSLASMIESMKIDAEMIREITDGEKKMSFQRKLSSHALERGVLELVEELKSLKSMVQEPDPARIQNLDVNDCKSRLTKLSNQIEDFRTNKNLDRLKEEESVLDTDLRDSERFFLLVERPVKTIAKRVGDKKNPVHDEPSDRFVELVARDGHTQGWNEEDHSLFLKIRKKCNSVPQLVTEFRGRRCHLTNEEVINHEAWYKLYSELREKRKKEIADWRSRRGVESKANNRGPRDDREGVPRVKSSSDSIEEKRKKIDREKKKMLDEWKSEKARKSAMDDEQKKRLEIARVEKENRLRKSARRKAIVKLQDYEDRETAKKWSSETNLRREVDQNCEKLNSRWLIESFRERDEKFVERRLKFLRGSQNGEQKEFAKSVETGLSKSRTLSTTLFTPTKVWVEKCKGERKREEIFGKVNYVKDIQKLAAQRYKLQS